jgi:hypothetical protein
MLRRFLGLPPKTTGPRRTEVFDPVLGNLTLEPSDQQWWEVQLILGSRPVTFAIGGDQEPSGVLLQHARDIVATFPVFEARITAFLAHEAQQAYARHANLASEARALRIEGINLFWPDRPEDGMIYFTGAAEGRVWRCDYVGREPRALGFDS